MYGDFIAPQFGLWGPLAVRTDNPASADKPAPCPPSIRARLKAQREEAAERAARVAEPAPRQARADFGRWPWCA